MKDTKHTAKFKALNKVQAICLEEVQLYTIDLWLKVFRKQIILEYEVSSKVVNKYCKYWR